MRRKLPPLYPLRAFEAAARHMSITKAAEELSITQSAVSHQVRTLEQFLGFALFERQKRHLKVTPEGQRLFRLTQEAFDLIDGFSSEISITQVKGTLTVGATPYLSAKWLVGRIGKFRALYPNIGLRLVHGNLELPTWPKGVNTAICWGDGSWPGLCSQPLTSIVFSPVCSPSLLGTRAAGISPQSLSEFQLLHEVDYSGWTEWAKLAGASHLNLGNGLVFDDANVMIDAAIEGQGVALAPFPFTNELVGAGRLAKLFDIDLATDSAYHLVCPESEVENPITRVFRDWILHEVGLDARPTARLATDLIGRRTHGWIGQRPRLATKG